MRLAFAALLLACALALAHASRADEERGQSRAKDAAEAVQEGNVSNWLKYYQRERERGGAPNAPAGESAPAPTNEPPAPRPERR